MGTKIFVLAGLLLLFSLTLARADIIMPGEHPVEYCAKIINTNDYPDYLFFHKGDKINNEVYVPITQGECFSFYKFNYERVYAIEKSNYAPGQETGFIESNEYIMSTSALPDSDPRTSVTEEYAVALDANAKTLSIRLAGTGSEQNVFAGRRVIQFVLALVLTIVLELVVAAAYIWLRKLPTGILAIVVIANIVSLPLVWFALPLLPVGGIALVVLSELFAIGAEYAIIAFAFKKLPKKDLAALVIAMNLFSWLAGGAVLWFLLTRIGI